MGINRSQIAKYVLVAIGTAGVVTLAIVAPNLIATLAKAQNNYKKYNNNQVNRSMKSLVANGMVSVREDNGRKVVKLTKKGINKFIRCKVDELQIIRPKKWDKKWRVVIFDIPEKLKSYRNQLSFKLRAMGFMQIQKSVWAHPFPCENEIIFLAEALRISPFVRFMLVSTIFPEEDLLEKFNL